MNKKLWEFYKERLVIYRTNNANYNNPVFESHLAVINTDPKVFQQIKKLIGKETLQKRQYQNL